MNGDRRIAVSRIVAIQFLSSAGEWMAIILLQVLLYRATGSARFILLLGLCEMIPAMIVGPWAGRMVDRMNLRRALTLSGLARIGLTALLAWPLLWEQPAAMLTVATALAIASRFFGPAAAALVPRLTNADQLAAASSWALAARTAGMAAGGGMTALIVSGGWPAILLGLLAPLTMALLLCILLPPALLAPRGRMTPGGTAPSIVMLIRKHRLSGPIGASMLVSFMLGVFELLAVPYGRTVLYQTEAASAFLFATYGVGLFVGLMLAAKPGRLPSWRRCVTGALAVMITASWLLGSIDRVGLALPVILGAGVAEGLILALCLVRVYEASEDGPVAACVALLDAATAAAFMAGYLFAGTLATALPVGNIMRVSALVAAALFFPGGVAVMWLERRRRPLPSSGQAESG